MKSDTGKKYLFFGLLLAILLGTIALFDLIVSSKRTIPLDRKPTPSPSEYIEPSAEPSPEPTQFGAKTAEEAVIGFLNAEKGKDFEKATQFISSEFARTIDYREFGGLSNPHISRFEIQGTKLFPDGKTHEVGARVYQEYTGEGDIGYNDNRYYVKLFGDRYLIDSIEYGEYVELPSAGRQDTP